VLKVPDGLPAAWVVGGSRSAGSPSEALLAIAEPGFDPASEVVLAGGGPRVPPPEGFRAVCTIRERRADRLVVDVEASGNGHLVVAEAYQDGWKASLDGGAVPVEPANVLFRAVEVPAGRHRVDLRYRPPAVFWGTGLTATGLVVAAVMLVRRGR
jgi:Bacterial membrane protein YfhO